MKRMKRMKSKSRALVRVVQWCWLFVFVALRAIRQGAIMLCRGHAEFTLHSPHIALVLVLCSLVWLWLAVFYLCRSSLQGAWGEKHCLLLV